jgi:hypothetical protein
MGETVNRRLEMLDGQIVFELVINREAHRDNVPSQAKISYAGDATTGIPVSIGLSKPTAFDARFRSGHYVRGYLHQTQPSRADGVLQTRIMGDFHIGVNRDDQMFEGVMAAVPVREA